MANRHVLQRLEAIRNILGEAHSGGRGLANALTGAERESFVTLVLNNVITPPFRIGSGEITDQYGAVSGQVDVVIEYGTSISLPLLQGNSQRLYLAESVCAVIEIKSNLAKQWDQVLPKAKSVGAIRRNPNWVAYAGSPPPQQVPFFVVGFEGWGDATSLEANLKEANASDSPVDGILQIDHGIYRGRDPDYSDHNFDGAAAIFGILLSIEQLTSSMLAAKPPFKPYVE